MGPSADDRLGWASADQIRAEELRDLLERYPDLSRTEKQRLRELYRNASATDMLAIVSSEALARKARRIDAEDEGGLIIAAFFVLSLLVVLAVTLA